MHEDDCRARAENVATWPGWKKALRAWADGWPSVADFENHWTRAGASAFGASVKTEPRG